MNDYLVPTNLRPDWCRLIQTYLSHCGFFGWDKYACISCIAINFLLHRSMGKFLIEADIRVVLSCEVYNSWLGRKFGGEMTVFTKLSYKTTVTVFLTL